MPFFREVKKSRKTHNCYFEASHVIPEKSHYFTFNFLDNLNWLSKPVCDACREKYSGFPTLPSKPVKSLEACK
jgi:hypothetical protein